MMRCARGRGCACDQCFAAAIGAFEVAIMSRAELLRGAARALGLAPPAKARVIASTHGRNDTRAAPAVLRGRRRRRGALPAPARAVQDDGARDRDVVQPERRAARRTAKAARVSRRGDAVRAAVAAPIVTTPAPVDTGELARAWRPPAPAPELAAEDKRPRCSKCAEPFTPDAGESLCAVCIALISPAKVRRPRAPKPAAPAPDRRDVIARLLARKAGGAERAAW